MTLGHAWRREHQLNRGEDVRERSTGPKHACERPAWSSAEFEMRSLAVLPILSRRRRKILLLRKCTVLSIDVISPPVLNKTGVGALKILGGFVQRMLNGQH